MKIFLNLTNTTLKAEKGTREEDLWCVERKPRFLLRFEIIFSSFCFCLCIFYTTHFIEFI
jgi:hypothetical protein